MSREINKMTIEEAINNLEDLRNEVYNEDFDGYDYAMAIDMAIKSLQKDIERHKMVIRASERHLNIVRCKDCKWYQGVHGVQGHAPCEWFNKQVLWSDFCSNGEPYKGGDTE